MYRDPRFSGLFQTLGGPATLFVGTLQGLIMQSMLAGDLLRIRRDAPRVFAIYLAGIRSAT